MIIYTISTLLLSLVLITKIFFISYWRGGTPGYFEYASIAVLIGILIFGTIDFLKTFFWQRKKNIKVKPSELSSIFFIILLLFLLASSMYVNFSKRAVFWDAAALYDARAKFMLQGSTFTQMVDFSKYDSSNSYYYVLYPPYTSMVHYFWYKLNIPTPVGVFYSVLLFFLGLCVFLLTRKKLGGYLALILTLITVSNNTIFLSSVMEYTNLPFTLSIVIGIFLIDEFIDDGKYWKLLYGAGLVVTTMWIRFLEPIWIGVILAMLIAIFIKKKFSAYSLIPILIGIYGIIEYSSWQALVTSFGTSTKIVSFSQSKLLELIAGLFNGSIISVLLFFIASWGPIILVYLFVALGIFIIRKKANFLQMIVFISIAIYFLGLYFVSFQSDWWKNLGDSLGRSSAFMVPLSAYLLFDYITPKKKNVEK
jgi:hypothetical protein